MGNQGCSACDFVQNTNQLRSKNIDPALLKPIQFSDHGSECPENLDQHQKSERKQGTTLSALGGQDSSLKINIRQIPPRSTQVLPHQKEQIQQLDLESKASKLNQFEAGAQDDIKEIKVPFTVIKLLIKPKILDQFRKVVKQYEKNFSSPASHSYHTWKMQSNGAYTNNIADGTTVILTQKSLYKGWTKIGEYIPENLGILIKQEGNYQGNFQEGLAHGKGIYTSWDGSKRFSGKWHKGELVEGKMETDIYTYEGQLDNSVPNGRGRLIVVDKKGYELFRYNGQFENGQFEGTGKYECSKYVYQGKFSQGKKNGFGILVERFSGQKKKKKRNENFVEGVKREGEWKDDKLIVQSKKK